MGYGFWSLKFCDIYGWENSYGSCWFDQTADLETRNSFLDIDIFF